MLSPPHLKIITDCAREFGVSTVWLFGSAMGDEDRANDIDLAVEGLPPEKYFSFYRRLFLDLPKPVDLVDMSQNPPIACIIRDRGIRIYEQSN